MLPLLCASRYKDGVAVVSRAAMPALDYDDVADLTIGARHVETEYWQGTLGDVMLRSGAYPPIAPDGQGLARAEASVLGDIYEACGGAGWAYAVGTDAVGGTRREPFNSALTGVNSISPAHLHVRPVPWGVRVDELVKPSIFTHPKQFTALFCP